MFWQNLALTSPAEIEATVRRNLAAVRETIATACARARRDAAGVRLVAVTKYAPPGAISALLACGQRELGENRVQQLERRIAEFGAAPEGLDVPADAAATPSSAPAGAPDGGRPPRWHMIGRLQRNKVRKLLPRVRVIHGLDSERLADEIERRAGAADCAVDALIEVNVSGEASKGGLFPDDLPRLVAHVADCPHVRLRGLMTMAPLEAEPEATRPCFARLRELLEGLRASGQVGPLCDQLSMGMSNDYAIAVEEGATIVRVGSALYEGLAPAAPLAGLEPRSK